MASHLPEHLLNELQDRYTAVLRARVDADAVAAASQYRELEQFCREQTTATGSPTFLCGLGVITEDDALAIGFFHEAIALARAKGESAHNILFPLATRHFHRDEFDLARRYATESHIDALAAGDQEAATEARVLLELIR